MSGWRQAVFVRQRRIEVIQRALTKILDEEAWSPATPRRLRIGTADASSRGWVMIVPELANFFVERDAAGAPRLARLARELRCAAYAVDLRGAAVALCEATAAGEFRLSGQPDSRDSALVVLERASAEVSFGLLEHVDELGARLAAHGAASPTALADYLGALAGFPGWLRAGEDEAAGELVFEPPRVATGAGVRARSLETREAIARPTPRAASPARDRTGRRPRSAARPRR